MSGALEEVIDFGDVIEEAQSAAPVEVDQKPKAKRGRPRKLNTPVRRATAKKGASARNIIRKSIAKKVGKSLKANGQPRKPHRFRPGTVALREIRRYQKGTELLFQKAPYQRLCREILGYVQGGYSGEIGRMTQQALAALQEAGEAFVVELMNKTNNATVNAGRSTVMVRDMNLVRSVQMPGLPPK